MNEKKISCMRETERERYWEEKMKIKIDWGRARGGEREESQRVRERGRWEIETGNEKGKKCRIINLTPKPKSIEYKLKEYIMYITIEYMM